MNKLKFITLALFLLSTLFNCTKDDSYLSQTALNSKLHIEKLNYDELLKDKDITPVLQKIKNKVKRNKNLQTQINRNVTIGNGLVILDDEIAKITLDNTISWTFMIETPTHETSAIENFMIKKHNGAFTYFLIKYRERTEINNEFYTVTLEALNGDALDTGGLDLFSRDAFDWVFPNDGGGTGSGPCEGILVYDHCNLGGNPDGHWPVLQNDGVTYCSGSPLLYIDFSHCENYGVPDPPVGDPLGGGDGSNGDQLVGGGGGSSGGDGDPTLTTLVGIIHSETPCDSRPEGDLNGDCQIDYYEACLLNGNPQEICECVQVGNNINDCFDIALNSYIDTLTDNEIAEFNWYEDNPSQRVDVKKLMKCFKDVDQSLLSPQTTYSLTIFIEQPVPNTDETYSGTDPGHTFVSMSINDPNSPNNNVTQVFGYYPATSVNPLIGNNTANGEFRDNSGHNYHVSVTINLNNLDFFNLVNFVETWNNPIPGYDLQTNNCTDFGIELGNLAGMQLPDTTGSWSVDIPLIGEVELGSGSNPGNLGQDVRNLNNSNITVNTTSGSPAQSSQGECN
ncbi:MAG: hypothetical protein GKR88_01360 [Flavobacteriaceae bacterium]|nr:MAG: hypothetical protein GKR88_01360 [Flavobacteriaceae bacterium]